MTTIYLNREQIHCGNLILVNQEYPLRETATDEPDSALVAVGGKTESVLLRRQAARLLECLMTELNGWKYIAPVSGFRSPDEQQKIWDDSLRENGPSYTRTYVALPDHSEHQTGMAIDLGLRREKIDFICPAFPYHGICQQFRLRAADYGFIQRYPAGKEDITGIGEEPWHFRYVGVPHAKIMTEGQMTLEEYSRFVRDFPYGKQSLRMNIDGHRILISYLAATEETMELLLDSKHPYTISGNNIDGFLLTEWRT